MGNQSNFDVVLIFSGETDDRLYQLRQWIGPLERLAEQCSLAVVTVNKSSTALLSNTKLKYFYYDSLDESLALFEALQPKILLYVSKGITTLKLTRNPNVVHVYLGHGESDKDYSAENTMKYFDYIFLSGPRGLKRIVEKVSKFPVDSRCVIVGRPQHLDTLPKPPAEFKKAENKTTVIYTPTADFFSVSNRYGTVASHGVEFARQILAQSDKYQLLYKPHPLTGTRIAANKSANEAIIQMIQEAGGDHFYDNGAFGWQLNQADVMVTDISAVAYDWLATGKPLLVTLPSTPGVQIYRSGILGALELIPETKAKDICNLLELASKDTVARANLEKWRLDYFSSPVEEKTGREKFIQEILQILGDPKKLPNTTSHEHQPVTARQTGGSTNNSTSGLVQKVIKNFFVLVSNVKTPTSSQWIAHYYGQKLDYAPIRDLASKERTELLVAGYHNFLEAMLWSLKNPTIARNLRIRYTPGRRHVTATLAKAKPKVIYYLSHGAKNHYSMRASGIEHHLYKPDSQKSFKVDHNLVAYDRVTVTKDETKNQIEALVRIPEGWAKKLSISGS